MDIDHYQKSTFLYMAGLMNIAVNLQLQDIESAYVTVNRAEGTVWVDYFNEKLRLFIGVCLDFKCQTVRIYRFECNQRSFDQAFLPLITGIKANADKAFVKIEMFASGTFSVFEKFPLYFYCAKYGFIPHPTYLSKILVVEEVFRTSNNQVIAEGFDHTENLFHTDDGLVYWQRNGFEWLAEFDLKPDSESMRYLNKELGLSGNSHLL